MPEHVVVLCACGSEAEAEQIAHALVESHLAACVNILSPVLSVYRWQGKTESASEWMLIVKTRLSRFQEVTAAIEALHSYELPEIIALPVVAGSPSYLKWIDQSTDE